MNPFSAGDVVVIEINDPQCKRPPRLAVITRTHGPVIHAEYVDAAKPEYFYGSYIYASFPPATPNA